MRLAIISAHRGADSLSEAVLSWGGQVPIFIEDGKDGMLPAYQRGFEAARTHSFDFFAFFHDDLIIHDAAWVSRVWEEFRDHRVGLVGFGGALQHGSPDIYQTPYDYHQLGRSHYLSNMTDAEVHGKRFTGSCRVAVLDGFALIYRRAFLEKMGGFPLNTSISYVGYDYHSCLMAHRLGYHIRVVGCAVTHYGGRTFVKLGLGQGPEHWQQFLDAHFYLYSCFKDILPVRIHDGSI